MQKKSLVVFGLCLILASLVFLTVSKDALNTPDPSFTYQDVGEATPKNNVEDHQNLVTDSQFTQNNNAILGSSVSPNQKANFVGTELSIEDISLIGIFYSQQWNDSLAEFQLPKQTIRASEDKRILHSQYLVKSIFADSVILVDDNNQHELRLTSPNTLSNMQTRYKYEHMTADEIGSRPKLIKHILSFDQNFTESLGKRVLAGVNPGLFRAARFKNNDVLVSINGVKVEDELALYELEQTLSTTHSLAFEVIRNGQRITLYLDIPGEALKIN